MQLSRSQIIILSICTGLIVANIYYCQPLIPLIAQDFEVLPSTAGRINYYTQAGYAVGLLFLVPLGDKVKRKKQIIICSSATIAALLIAAFSPNLLILSFASFLIGFTSIIPQLILPLAANLTDDKNRGAVVGTIMSGLLIGILLSRTLSGYIGEVLGWRSMFQLAAGICFLVIILLYKTLPESKANYQGSYLRLMSTMWKLIKTQPILRQASTINAITFAAFNVFWTTMVLLLAAEPFSYSSNRIGLFGLAGAVGALAAPFVGRLNGEGRPVKLIRIGLLLQIVSFILAWFAPASVFYLIGTVIILDIGQQAIHVTNQTRIYALLPEYRNRLNTVFMTFSFIGAAAGSAIGIALWKFGKWEYVCMGSIILIIFNLGISYFNRKLK